MGMALEIRFAYLHVNDISAKRFQFLCSGEKLNNVKGAISLRRFADVLMVPKIKKPPDVNTGGLCVANENQATSLNKDISKSSRLRLNSLGSFHHLVEPLFVEI